MIEILEASVKLGLPLMGLSWLLYSWLYREGQLDSSANRKATDASLKELKKNRKKNRNSHQGGRQNFLLDKWLWMGGGFYGLAALWTLIVVEIIDFFNFIFNIAEFFSQLENGLGGLISSIITNQIANLVSAFVWFNYWSGAFNFKWVLIAYLGYIVGIKLAKKGIEIRAWWR